MSSNTLQTALGLLVIAVVPLIAYGAWKQHVRRREAWRALAQAHGWSFNHSWGSLEVEGLYQGQQLSLLTERRGHGKNSYSVTVLRLDLGHALPPELSLEPEHFGDRLLKAFGVKDEELGDAALDEAFDLERLSPQARAVLRAPRVAPRLLALPRAYPRFSIEAGLLEAEQRGIPATREALEGLLAPALALADALHAVAADPSEQMRG